MPCERCGNQNVVTYGATLATDSRELCVACFHELSRAQAAADEARIRDMAVEWDKLRPILARAEELGVEEHIRRLADMLEFSVQRYGRVLPPDVAAFLARHRRSRPPA